MHETTNELLKREEDGPSAAARRLFHQAVLADAYECGRADGIWIGAIGSPFVIALILALAWYLDL